MERTAMMILILIIYTIYAAIKHRAVWKKLTTKQIFNVILTYIIMTAIGATVLYFGIYTMKEATSNELLSNAVQFIYAVIIVGFGVLFFNITISRITNNILPVQNEAK